MADTRPAAGLGRSEANSREERRQLVELLALPAIGFMIVAVRTLNLHAEENPRDLGRNVGSVAILRHDQSGCPVLSHVPRGGDEAADNLVPRRVLVELVTQIFEQRLGRKLCPIVGAMVHDHIAPITPPVVAEVRIVE